MECLPTDTAELKNGAADTVAIVIHQRLVRECVGPQLTSLLPGYNVKLLAWPDDLAELGDWCSISLIILWAPGEAMNFGSTLEAALEAAAAKRPIAILSDFADPIMAGRALTLGIRGYLSASMSLAELASAIRILAEGGTYIPSSVLVGMTTARPALHENNRDVAFSPRQLEILQLLHEGRPNKVIAYELGMAEATVKVHIRMIMKKLNANNRTQVVLKTKRLQGEGAPLPVACGTASLLSKLSARVA